MNESCDPPSPDDLHTISAAGFSATVDAFARDERDRTLWFLSMVGSQTALKAIWAALLKQPPETAHLICGADGTALSGGYQRCMIPRHTVGTWTTKIARLPATGGWHALVYTKLAEFSHDSDSFLLLARPCKMRARLAQATVRAPFRRGAATLAIQRPSVTKNTAVCRTPFHQGELMFTHQNEDTRTLRKSRRGNRRRQERNLTAWQGFSPDGDTCRYCRHPASTHLCTSGQPIFYRPATDAERHSRSVRLYRHETPENGPVLLRRMVVARAAELITVFCVACAEEMSASQVACFQRNTAVGEVVGISPNGKERP